MSGLLAALEGSGFAAQVRESIVLYPAANVLHVLAVMVFFAGVAAMDLRILGLLPGPDPARVVARLRPLSAAALGVIVASGVLLFLPEATRTAGNPAFLAKLVAIGVAVINLAVNDLASRRGTGHAMLVRATAAVSLALWLVVAALGRLIAYV
ncbi:hypothetical protein PQJ75_30645 [Rhodoplanes sp. TEM]|uniref:DUF6644 domain-containing protein n=1 Tax=Rhodoplanes tepidamans TaxID=200616 RepID=A0ABT5JLE3_RHOTP|nr:MULTISPECIES: DUF6644 family protein [Rhodoplanes]MDC7790053.1 hypothetical protein [Rhodoplanes tepidamans]MDC7988109.1 hypothetical protein [Rhodoplanes sp. TEM]MDQ0359254.1 hypothetical protein [Rhodoplanes tepidamans]